MHVPLRLALLLQETADPAAPTPRPEGGGFMSLLPMLAGVLLIFYFLAWRPQARDRRQREQMLGNLKKGDRVILNSGLYGTVAALHGNDLTLKVDEKNNVRLKFSRQAVQTVLTEPEEKEPAEE